MKKTILLILIILITGCSNNHKLNINNVQTINYNDINLLETDWNDVLTKINSLEFKEGKTDDTIDNQLKIVSSSNIYDFKILNDIIYYEENGKTYISQNINNLKNMLGELEKKYTDFSFFEFTYHKCDITNNKFIIKIDNTNNCLILKTNKPLYNFKINSIQTTEDYLEEFNMIYQNDEIKSNNIIIKTNIVNIPKIKISFDTEYNYTLSLLPILDDENNIILNFSSNQKK